MSVDEHRKHAEAFIVFDKPHSPHIRSEIVNDISRHDSLLTRLFCLAIKPNVLDVSESLIPLVHRLDVYGPDIGVSLHAQISAQMAADESASAADNDFTCFHCLL